MTLFRKEVSKERVKIFFLGHQIYSRRHSRNYICYLNNKLHDQNKVKIKYIIKKSKRILYVMDNLILAGGVETRLKKQLNYISQYSFESMILTEDGNAFKPLQKYPNFRLFFHGDNFTDCLIDFVQYAQIDIVEFQVKADEYLKKIDFSKLRKFCKTGICLHNDANFDNFSFDWFDYAIRSVPTMGYDFLKGITFIPNWIHYFNPIWKYQNQNKALFISRLDDEKLPTLKSFIHICKMIGCDFEIAGNFSGENTEIEKLVRSFDRKQYIGCVDTYDFLEKNCCQYLFIGGVGQVAIEGASFGVPSLVCTHFDDFKYSRFITKEQLLFLIEHNFVIRRYVPDSLKGNICHFMHCMSNGNFSDFNVICSMKKHLSEQLVMMRYLKILNNML